MKKSIIGTLGLIIVFALIIGDRFLLKEETADDHGQAVGRQKRKSHRRIPEYCPV